MDTKKIMGKLRDFIAGSEKHLCVFIDKLRYWEKILSVHTSRFYPAAKCGHVSKQIDNINLEDGQHTLTLEVTREKVAYCHKCLEQTAVVCALCRKPILLGQPVAVFTPKFRNFIAPKGALVFREHPLQLVGCIRKTCFHPEIDSSYGYYLLNKKTGKGMVVRQKISQEHLLKCQDVLS